jgi:hypothetical protein
MAMTAYRIIDQPVEIILHAAGRLIAGETE